MGKHDDLKSEPQKTCQNGSQLAESRFSPLGVELVPAYHSGPVLQKEVPRARCPKEGRGVWRVWGGF